MNVIDLFAGMGGLASGFAKEGFTVVGYDINPLSKEIFKINKIGNLIVQNLLKETIIEHADIIIGGPPCRPWSCINVTRRGSKHPDYKLLDRFFKYVLEMKPVAFLMENVLPLKSDCKFEKWMNIVRKSGYFTRYRTVKYSDFGAATSRRRLIITGFIDKTFAEEFFLKLEEYRAKPRTVMEAIQPFLNIKKGGFPDHEWPELKTIKKYEHYYRTGKFGWYRLNPDRPAPSFGNVMKTYILHPFAGVNGIPMRVISIREAMSIMGFDMDFKFPSGSGMTIRYQMVSDAVSPIFSQVCAKIIKKVLK